VTPRSTARHLRVYRVALLLYPSAFRRSYREPMLQLFGDCVRDAGPKVWLRTVPDLVRTIPSLQLEAVMSARHSASRVVAIALVVAAGVVAALGFGGPAMFGVVGIAVLAVLGIGRGGLVPVFRGERAPLRHALVQTWWAPVAGFAGGALLFVGFGTIFEAQNWGGRIFGSAIMLAFGFGTLYGLTRRPFSRSSGNALILITTIPGFLFFWVVIPTIISLVIWIGVLTSGFSDESVAPAPT
jgi:hypothetical protein